MLTAIFVTNLFAEMPNILLTRNLKGDSKLIQEVVSNFENLQSPKNLIATRSLIGYKETFIDSAKILESKGLTNKFEFLRQGKFSLDSLVFYLENSSTNFNNFYKIISSFPKVKVVFITQNSDLEQNFYLVNPNGQKVLFLTQNFEAILLKSKSNFYDFEILDLTNSKFESLYSAEIKNDFWVKKLKKNAQSDFLINKDFTQNSFKNLVLHSTLKNSKSEVIFYQNNDFDFSNWSKNTEDFHLKISECNEQIYSENNFYQVKMSGRILKELMKNSESEFLTVDHLSKRNFKNDESLIWQEEINSNANYKVCFDERFLQNYETSFQNSPTKTLNLREAFLVDFENFTGLEFLDSQRFFQENGYVTQPIWNLSFEDINLNFGLNRVKNRQSYSEISESELQGENYLDIQLSSNIFLTRTTRYVRWKNQFFTEFGRIKLRKDEFVESKDDIFVKSGLDWNSKIYNLSPFTSFKFDSEITKGREQRQKDFQFDIGFELPRFIGFRNSRISYARIFDLSRNNRVVLNGIQFESFHQMTFNQSAPSNKKIRLRSNLETIFYFDDSLEGSEGRVFKLDLNTKLKVPISESLSFKPEINVFLFKGDNGRKWASTFEILIGLSYSSEFKFH